MTEYTTLEETNNGVEFKFEEHENDLNEDEKYFTELDDGKEIDGSFVEARRLIATILNYIFTRLFIVLLIILDMVIVIVSIILAYTTTGFDSELKAFDILSLILICIFFIELLLRIFVELEHFSKSWFNIIDGLIITLSFIITAVLFAFDANSDGSNSTANFLKLISIGRIIRLFLLVRSIRLLLQSEGLQKSMRLIVRGNKRGYQKDGFDLDLCYITPRMIAMSFPSSGLEGAYRNKIEDVARFLDTKHKDAYKVYNLCSEKSYEASHFHDRVMRFYIDDHNVPTLRETLRFAKDVKEWMEANQNNTIAIHCKGGKGRTGTMICIWLLESRQCSTAKQALEYFGTRRTDWGKGAKFQGVETPSQSRFVGYYEQIIHKLGGSLPEKRVLRLTKVIISSIKGVGNSNGSDFTLTVYTEGKREVCHSIFGNDTNCKRTFEDSNNRVILDNIGCEPFHDEVKIMFRSTNKEVPKYYDACAFFFTFHTSFIDSKTNSIRLGRNDLDNPHREKFWHVYKENFTVECFFSVV